MTIRAQVMNRHAARLLAIVAATGLTLLGVMPASTARAGLPSNPSPLALPAPGTAAAAALRVAHGFGKIPEAPGVPGHLVQPGHRPDAGSGSVARPKPTQWPAAGTATVNLAADHPSNRRGARPHAAGVWIQAGSLPVSVAAPAAAYGHGADEAADRITVSVASHRASLAAGGDALAFSVIRPGRIVASDKAVRIRIDYGSFVGTSGGGLGARLALFREPGCALTTPMVSACHTRTRVQAVNNWNTRSITATVMASPAGRPVTYAVNSTSSDGTGDYKATPLTPSSQWNVGLQDGDFTWSYPLRVPPPIGGKAPSLAITYDSAASDGETSQSNSQPGQLGEGFSMSGGGYIERQYAPCGDIIAGTITGVGPNNTGQTAATGDQCWDGYNAYLSLDGHSGEMIYDPSGSGSWHLAGDDGSTVNYLSGGNNGSHNNTYWEIITPDGTQYWFGLNQLPGWQAGNAVTNSVWTEPVVGLSAGHSLQHAK